MVTTPESTISRAPARQALPRWFSWAAMAWAGFIGAGLMMLRERITAHGANEAFSWMRGWLIVESVAIVFVAGVLVGVAASKRHAKAVIGVAAATVLWFVALGIMWRY